MIYCFTGMPLAGKTTWSKRFAEQAGLPRLSTGDYARSLGMGNEASIRTLDQSLIYDDAIRRRVSSFLEESGSGCVLDGYPRSREQYAFLEARHCPFKVVFMTANPVVIFDRLESRAKAGGRPEDERETVLGRVRRSVEWRLELKALAGDSFMDTPEEEGYEGLLRRLKCAGS